MSVIIETSIGDFTVDLYTDERPKCCLNFLKLCKIKYYNFSLFHNVQENLVAQTGDPTATGRGGESIFASLYGEQARFFDMEVSPRIKHTRRGLVSMVNNGSGMHGSQFFLTLADSLDYLDGKHTVFGEIAEGFDVLDKLNKTFCDDNFRPHQDIRIYHTVVLDDPYDDPDGLVIPASSPGPTEEMLASDRIPCDADIHEDEGFTTEELAEKMAEKEAKANTQILEMVGDLPDANVAPPENVLFVCKLNPVTTSEDLEIIFSRFGNIVNCDVIKDSKTGESLQYAFIEFESQAECENAYFKMDNVLIDDRRIHVDFSQSVSKLKWKGKGQGVDIMASGDAPIYVLKNQERRADGYDLVYDHDDDSHGGKAVAPMRTGAGEEHQNSHGRMGHKGASSRSTHRHTDGKHRNSFTRNAEENSNKRRDRNGDRESGSREQTSRMKRRHKEESHTDRREDHDRRHTDRREDHDRRHTDRREDHDRRDSRIPYSQRERYNSPEVDKRRNHKRDKNRRDSSASSEDRIQRRNEGSQTKKDRRKEVSSEDEQWARKKSRHHEEDNRGISEKQISRKRQTVKHSSEEYSSSDSHSDSHSKKERREKKKKKKSKHNKSKHKVVHRSEEEDERRDKTKKAKRKACDSDSEDSAENRRKYSSKGSKR